MQLLWMQLLIYKLLNSHFPKNLSLQQSFHNNYIFHKMLLKKTLNLIILYPLY